MKLMGTALLSAASLLAAGSAMAAEPQWTYLQAGWIQGDGFDDFGKTDGFEVKGSLGFLQNFHAQLSYVDGEISDDDFSSDPDFDGYNVLLGYHQAISSSGNTQFVADLNYFDIDFDGAEGFNGDNKGYGVGFGLRSMLADKFELEGKVTYTRGELDFFGDSEDYTDTGLQIAGRYHWTSAISTGITLTLNDTTAASYVGGDSAVFDVRWTFGDIL